MTLAQEARQAAANFYLVTFGALTGLTRDWIEKGELSEFVEDIDDDVKDLAKLLQDFGESAMRRVE